MKDISQCKHGLTQRWRHYFEIALFSIRTLKMALWKQRYLCQKFPLPIPIHTWKISWIERLIYFLLPHMANWSRLTMMWQSNVCHQIVFIVSFCFRRLDIQSQAFKKNPSVQPLDLTVWKKFASVQPFSWSVSNGLSSCFWSIHLPCVQPFARIS